MLGRHALVAIAIFSVFGVLRGSAFGSNNEKLAAGDIAVLQAVKESLLSPTWVKSPEAGQLLIKKLPSALQRYRLALVCWSLLRPTGPEESDRSRLLEATFWLSVRTLSESSDKNLVRKLIDDCHLQSGELLQALEFLYHGDEDGLRAELRRRGITDRPQTSPMRDH